ncbi:hypothetical protein F2981_20270 (plasmid) [Sinorhizobium meliloti]|nr:hypothetical protein [Sinorhizobium meliloti]
MTPFLFYSIGGYCALQARLDIGQLVAVIGAYKDLPGPLEGIDRLDQGAPGCAVKYAQVSKQFQRRNR